MQGKGVHFGYIVVAALVLVCLIPLSFALSCPGVFYPSVSAYLGVETGMLSYYTTFIWIAALVTLPLLGRLLAKCDARLCLTGAVALVVVCLVWLSQMTALWQFYLAAFVSGIAIAMMLFLAPSTIINRWFAKRAGAMLGFTMAFTGVGGVIWSTVGGMLINAIGWSATYLVFAALAACVLPATIFMIRSYPADKGLLPVGADGLPGVPGAKLQSEAPQPSFRFAPGTLGEVDALEGGSSLPGSAEESSPLRGTNGSDEHAALVGEGVAAAQAYRMPAFYIICAFCFFLNIGMYVYFMIPSYAATLEIGMALPLLGATASSVAMAGQTISKLALGVVGERFPRASTACALIAGIVGVALFAWFTGSAAFYYAAALLFGLYYGITNVMLPLFTRQSFGNRDYAQIYSKVSMVASVSNAASALLWGTIIDATHSFMPLFVGSIALMVLSILCIMPLKKKLAAA